MAQSKRIPRYKQINGGNWEKTGKLQIETLQELGLTPKKRLLDVGCGAGKLAVKAIPFLNKGNYAGFDPDKNLFENLKQAFADAKVDAEEKGAEFGRGTVHDIAAVNGMTDAKFHFAWAWSIFTHLPEPEILAILNFVKDRLYKSGKFYATAFIVEDDSQPVHQGGHITTHKDKNPFHQTLATYERLAEEAGLKVQPVDNLKGKYWHQLLEFTLA